MLFLLLSPSAPWRRPYHGFRGRPARSGLSARDLTVVPHCTSAACPLQLRSAGMVCSPGRPYFAGSAVGHEDHCPRVQRFISNCQDRRYGLTWFTFGAPENQEKWKVSSVRTTSAKIVAIGDHMSCAGDDTVSIPSNLWVEMVRDAHSCGGVALACRCVMCSPKQMAGGWVFWVSSNTITEMPMAPPVCRIRLKMDCLHCAGPMARCRMPAPTCNITAHTTQCPFNPATTNRPIILCGGKLGHLHRE